MNDRSQQHQKVAEVAREIGPVLRRQARKRWEAVRMAERNEGNRHVWRFSNASDGGERFLHVPHAAMVRGDTPAATLLAQLRTGEWMERMEKGPETAFVLSKNGRVTPYTAN